MLSPAPALEEIDDSDTMSSAGGRRRRRTVIRSESSLEALGSSCWVSEPSSIVSSPDISDGSTATPLLGRPMTGSGSSLETSTSSRFASSQSSIVSSPLEMPASCCSIFGPSSIVSLSDISDGPDTTPRLGRLTTRTDSSLDISGVRNCRDGGDLGFVNESLRPYR